MLQTKAIRLGLWVLYLILAAMFADGAEFPAAGGDPARHADARPAIAYADGLGPRREAAAKPVKRPLEPVPRQPPMLKPYGPLAGAQVRTLDFRDYWKPAQWEWTPARPHHACMVRLQVGEAAGSGVYVHWYGDSGRRHRGILTAKHVVEGSASIAVRWIDGQHSRGMRETLRYDRYEHDVALFRCDDYHPAVDPMPIARRSPREGEDLEVCGYGTGGTTLRNFYTRVSATGRYDTSDVSLPGPVHGDSGGGVVTVDERGVLSVASVVSAGGGPTSVDGERAYKAMLYPRPSAVQEFARRVATEWEQQSQTQCGPNGCPPRRGNYQQPPPDDWGNRRKGGNLFPPDEPYRLGPRTRGPDIDIDIDRRGGGRGSGQRRGPRPETALAMIVAAGLIAAALCFRNRI